MGLRFTLLEKEHANELLYCITMTDAFLFQTQVMLGKVNERGVFLRSQMRESSDGTGSAWDTKICEGGERFPIHH